MEIYNKGSERCHTISALWCDGRCRHGTDPECNECQEGAEGNRAMDLELFSTWGINTRNNAFVVENVLLFIPYGFACPWAFPWLRGFFRNIFAAFVTSLGVETFQLITGRGYFQIDDILTNVLGGIIGYWMFWLVYHTLQRIRGSRSMR